MTKHWVGLAVLAALWTAAPVGAKDLAVGDPAPKIEVKEFVKGDPVEKFDKGKLYVVEFWATWCGPCRTSIPHLTELQKKHKDVTFIGVSVYENNQDAVKPFVKEMGEKMDYRVALDAIPEGGKRNDGKMAQSWMEAAQQEGIPTAFIVNGDGNVAWIGHPMTMEKPLDQIVKGTWDLKVAAADFQKAQAQQKKMRELQTKLSKAQRSGDSKEIVAVVDAAVADDPTLEPMLAFVKFNALANPKDANDTQEKAAEYAQHLIDKVYKDNAQGLNNVAWTIVDPKIKRASSKLTKAALAAAQRADELAKEKDGMIADTLARAYFVNGDANKALETQERALKLAKGNPRLENDPELKERLEEYRKAAKK